MMSAEDRRKMLELLLTPEDKLEGITLSDWFSPEFFDSVFWFCWSSMFAFRLYHSLIEVRRYLLRYADLDSVELKGLNEYELVNALPSEQLLPSNVSTCPPM